MRTALFALVGLLSAAGCVSADPSVHLNEVASDVKQRSGQRPAWSDEARGEQARQAVQELLDGGLTADGAVRIALLRNRRLQAAYHDVGIASAQRAQADALPNPIADLVLRYPSGGGRPEIDAGLTQEVLSLLLRPARGRVAQSLLDATKRDVTSQVLDTIFDAQATFIRLQAAQQDVELWQQIVQATSAGYELVLDLHAAGNVRDLDLDRERALDARARLELSAALERLVVQRERLNALLRPLGPGDGLGDGARSTAGPSG